MRSTLVLATALLSSTAFADGPAVLSTNFESDGSQVRLGEEDLPPGFWSDAGVEKPSTPDTPVANIVGGLPVAGGNYPEVVHINIGDGGCTGSLIDPQWVLTAAHCFDPDSIDRNTEIVVTFANDVGDALPGDQVRAGVVNTPPALDAAVWGSDFIPPGVIPHPSWQASLTTEQRNQESTGWLGDIALIRLETPQTDRAVMALNSAVPDQSWLGEDVHFVGYGLTATGATGSTGVKRTAPVPITDVESEFFRTFNGSQSTCQGDSGGPGVLRDPLGYKQISVTSHGAVPCGAGPAGVVRVDNYIDWITENISSQSTPPGRLLAEAVAPPSFACSHELSPEEEDTIAIGTVPFDFKCQARYAFPDNINSVTWDWGDGVVDEDGGDAPTHTYETSGSFNVQMCMNYDITVFEEGEPVQTDATHCVSKYAYVRSCAVPDVVFSFEQTGPRRIAFDNRTDLSSYGCTYSVQWDIYEGDSASGTPVESVVSWSPVVTLEKAGTYTATLHVGGLGGVSAAELTFKVSNTRSSGGCSHGGGLGGLGLAALGMLAFRRRRD